MFGVARLNTLAKGASTPTSLTFVNFQTSTTTSLNPPTLQTGDLLVCFCVARNTTTTIPTIMAPAGWTSVGSSPTVGTTQGTRAAMFYKISAGNETTITTMSGTQSTASWSASWRPNAPITTVTVGGGSNFQLSDAQVTNLTLTMSGVAVPYVGFGNYFTNGSPTTVYGATTTTTVTATRSFGPSGNLWTNIYEANGSTNSTLGSTSDWGSGNGIWGLTLSVS